MLLAPRILIYATTGSNVASVSPRLGLGTEVPTNHGKVASGGKGTGENETGGAYVGVELETSAGAVDGVVVLDNTTSCFVV